MPAAWNDDVLKAVELELARRIGPLARVLVKRAARTAGTLEELGAVLAENIPSEADRGPFRDAVRKLG